MHDYKINLCINTFEGANFSCYSSLSIMIFCPHQNQIKWFTLNRAQKKTQAMRLGFLI